MIYPLFYCVHRVQKQELILSFLNSTTLGITVNATYNGGEIDQHYAEAERVMKLCNVDGKIPLYSGANGDFEEISSSINEEVYIILPIIRSAV